MLLIARRRGGRPLLWWTALLLVALLAMGPVAFDVWNPSVTLLPFTLTLMLAWCVACLDWWALPWLVLTGTFAVQTHVGLAPGVMTALVVAVGVGVWRRRRAVAGGRGTRTLVDRGWMSVSAAVGVVLWLPPIIQQVTSPDRNLPPSRASSCTRAPSTRCPTGSSTPPSRPRCPCAPSSNR